MPVALAGAIAVAIAIDKRIDKRIAKPALDRVALGFGAALQIFRPARRRLGAQGGSGAGDQVFQQLGHGACLSWNCAGFNAITPC